MIRRPSFFRVFGKSPFIQLRNHMKIVQQTVTLLPGFFDACQEGAWDEAALLKDQISELESEADKIKRKLQLKLHGDLFLPVPRSDILALLQVQDNIANKAEDLATLMLGRKMSFPSAIQPHIRQLLEHMVTTCDKASEVNSEMKDLMEAGFAGVVIQLLRDMVKELDQLEDEADVLQAGIWQSIAAIEDDHKPLDVLFWYQFVKEISSVIDWAQRVGTQLLIISAR